MALLLSPAAMLSGTGKPTTTISQFKRFLHRPEEDDGENKDRDTVTVRIAGSKVSTETTVSLHLPFTHDPHTCAAYI